MKIKRDFGGCTEADVDVFLSHDDRSFYFLIEGCDVICSFRDDGAVMLHMIDDDGFVRALAFYLHKRGRRFATHEAARAAWQDEALLT